MVDLVAQASLVGIGQLLRKQARVRAGQVALVDGSQQWTYREVNERVDRLAALLLRRGIGRGDRVAVLAENSHVYVELLFAAARVGAIIAALNWRLGSVELRHCVDLVEPRMLVVSARMKDKADALQIPCERLPIGPELEQALLQMPAKAVEAPVAPEDGLLIVYTSGTTGLPKGALISHRAMLARLAVYCTDYGINGEDTFPAWSPLFHIASAELAIGSLLLGGKVVTIDGIDLPLICDLLESDPISNVIFFPGMIEETLAYLRERRPRPRRVKKFGALADLYSPHELAALTGILGLPFTNTFGSTETGIGPASAGRIPVGVVPTSLSKTESSYYAVRLVDDQDVDVPDGQPGELITRSAALFSGYWNAPEANAEAFRGGWYHTGDVFVRNPQGLLDYVDRKKYLIKSGGENIYPAEIERVVMRDKRIIEAVAVRRRDDKWGEVPVLVMASRDPAVDAALVQAMFEAELSKFKRPKQIYFVDEKFFPR
ncbi:MAG: class I adenylate-forming enzyme family protein, partial [Burkholderiaceae bacterium]|nr:class I adenylate-forming enzyme family protein [Burkholderiaceae bacterium]